MANGWYATYNDFGATWGKKIGAAGIAIYQSLASRSWDGQCFPSYQTIADDTGVSRPTAIKYIKILQEVGLIEVQPRFNRRGDPTSHLYTLTNLPLLKKKAEAEAKLKFEEIDISGLSEEEIAELKRKSLFLPRSKKKSRKSVVATSETAPVSSPVPPVEQVTQVTELKAQVYEPPSVTIIPIDQQDASQGIAQYLIPTPESTLDTAPKKVVNEERIELGEFGKISSKKDVVNAYHMLKGIPNKQQVIDELNKAIRENRIQTTPIQYLYGLIKKVEQGEFVPTANKKTEDELFREQQERAAEKENERKKAITECSRCSQVGHLVYSAIDPFSPKVKICTHDEKADQFIAQKKAEEARGETICYFGKGKPLDGKTAQEALDAIRGTVTAMTGKTPTTIPLTPEPFETEQQSATVAQSQPIPEPVKQVEPIPPAPNATETSPTPETKPEGEFDGFKSMGELTTHLMNEMAARKIEPDSDDEDYGLPQLSPKLQPTMATADMPKPVLPDELPPIKEEESALALLRSTNQTFGSGTLTMVPEHVISEPPSPELSESLEGFGQYTEKQKEKLLALALTAKLPEPTGTLVRPNGKPVSIIAEKIMIIKQELENLYCYDELIVQKEVRRYIGLQSVVRCARLRILIDKHPVHSDWFKGQALRFANAIQAAAPVMLTVSHARRNRLIIDSLIENFEAPPQAPINDPSSDIMAQRYLDLLQEFQVVRKYLAIELDKKHQREARAKTRESIDILHKEVRGEKQHQLLNLIQDEMPEVKGDIVAANEHMPPEWKCSPHELHWVYDRESIRLETSEPVTPLPPIT